MEYPSEIWCMECDSMTNHRPKLDAVKNGKLVCNICDRENNIRNMERPDKWVIIKIEHPEHGTIYKVLAAWLGGYLDGDYWRMNSGIDRIEEEDTHFKIYGFSGSCYNCGKHYYGTSSFSQGILENLIKKAPDVGGTVTLMPADTDWLKLIKENDCT
jgi:hypothetical protein